MNKKNDGVDLGSEILVINGTSMCNQVIHAIRASFQE